MAKTEAKTEPVKKAAPGGSVPVVATVKPVASTKPEPMGRDADGKPINPEILGHPVRLAEVPPLGEEASVRECLAALGRLTDPGSIQTIQVAVAARWEQVAGPDASREPAHKASTSATNKG